MGLLDYTMPISKADLKPGDILLDSTGDDVADRHVVIFEYWADSGHTSYKAIEQVGGIGTTRRTVPYPYFSGGPFYPRRYKNIVDGTAGAVQRDLNRDGKADLLGVHNNGDLYRFYGAGNGSFYPGTVIGWGWENFRLVTGGDVTSDGAADLLAVRNDGYLFRYDGTGTGLFEAGEVVGPGWGDFRLITAGDVTRDGVADLLGVRTDGTLWSYTGNGGGGFNAGDFVGGGWSVFRMFTSDDYTGDRRADLLAVHNDGSIWRYVGNGSGGFYSGVSAGGGWSNFRIIL